MMKLRGLAQECFARNTTVSSLMCPAAESGAISLVQIRRDTALLLVGSLFSPAPLCHEDTAQFTPNPLLGAFLSPRCVFMAYSRVASMQRKNLL